MTLTEVSDEAYKSYRLVMELVQSETERLEALGIKAGLTFRLGVSDFPGAPSLPDGSRPTTGTQT